MSTTRQLLSTVLLIAVLVPGLALAADGLEFLAPEHFQVLLGQTRFEFEVTTSLDRIDVYAGGRMIGTAKPPHWELLADVPYEAVGQSIHAVGFFAEKPVARAELPTRKVRINQEVDVIRVQLYPVVKGSGGKYVSDLSKEDFEVRDDGVPVAIESFETRPKELNLAVLLDVSESMRDALLVLQGAATRFVDQLEPDDRVSVFAFNDTIEELLPLGGDREEAKEQIVELHAEGSTALYDSIIRIVESLRGVKGRKVALVFSDGRDLASISSAERVVRQARQSEVLLYTIGPAGQRAKPGRDTSADELRETLEFIANETGGEAFFIYSTNDLDRVFSEILLHLRAQYELVYIPKHGEPGYRKIEVRVKRPGLKAHARRSYYHGGRR